MGDEKEDVKTFTQAEVDEFVRRRVARANNKIRELEYEIIKLKKDDKYGK